VNVADVMLPYRTDWRAMASLLDYAKGKGIDRPTLEARLGAGEALRETLNAVEQLGLVVRDEGGDVRLTPLGERVAYASSEGQRREELAGAMLRYLPYAIPLERALVEELSVLDGPWVERVWQVDMRLGQPRNRVEEARTFYFRLADEAGLGSYRRGVRGQPTRLDLSPDLAPRLAELRQEEQSAAPSVAEQAPAPGGSPTTVATITRPGGNVSLQITVDLSGWELDRIEAFLRLVGLVHG